MTMGTPLASASANWVGAYVDLLHYPLLVLELVDGVLQLLVQDHPVGHDDDRVEDLLVLVVVKARQAMGQPGDGVDLAAAGRMLDQVVGPGALLPGVRPPIVARNPAGDSAERSWSPG